MFFQQSVTDKELYINILDIFREIKSNILAYKNMRSRKAESNNPAYTVSHPLTGKGI